VREHESEKKEHEMADTVKDVVCGMDIDPRNAVAKMDYEGKTYYFCSDACHQKFMSDPAKYEAI
jgi:Cu+-exporting ATPase